MNESPVSLKILWL